MGMYVVRGGDCFASIAARWGMTVEALRGLGNNEDFGQDGNSEHELTPGDVIEVPDQPPNRSTSFSSGGSKTYKVKIPKVRFRLRLKDRQDQAYKDKRYELVIDEQTYEGTTDDAGWVEQDIPAAATEGWLFVFLDDEEHPWEMRLLLGGLDALETESGVVQRLSNLGYGSARKGQAGLAQAIAEFQRHEGLTSTGTIDVETRDRLRARQTEDRAGQGGR